MPGAQNKKMKSDETGILFQGVCRQQNADEIHNIIAWVKKEDVIIL
jgi:hypothetical protein